MLRDIERGGRIEADHIVGDLIARGTQEGTRLLRVAYVHLKGIRGAASTRDGVTGRLSPHRRP